MSMTTVTKDPKLARLFIPICKIDEEQRLVYGKMTFEGEDSAGEIWDYEGSKPYFEAWSANAEKSSGGKSLGNLRSMHQPIAAGKLTQFVLDDDERSVYICGKVVDDGEWGKVLEGVYTGFSQGGRYVKRWKDPEDNTKTRYISDPVEVSLVDLPCLPGAEFEYVKADGSVELRKFTNTQETSMYEPTNEEVAARATHIAKSAGGAWTTHIETAVAELKAEHAAKAAGASEPAAEPAPAPVAEASIEAPAAVETDVDKAKGAKDPEGDDAAEEGSGEGNGDGDPKDDKGTEEADDAEDEKKAKAKKARDSLVQVWLTPEQQELLGKAAFVKAADAVSAIIGEDEPTPASPVAAALAAAKAAASGEPELVKFVPTEGLEVARASLGTLVEKGLWTASRSLDVLESVISLQCSAAFEAEYERDGSSVPGQLADAARALGEAALAMCQEEIAEALSGLQSGEVEVETLVTNAAEAEFVKGILGNEELMKVGARNARSDKERIQKIHDNSVDLGADCTAEEAADKLAKAAESSPLIKGMLEQNEILKTQVSEAVDGIGELTKTIGDMRGEITALKATPAPMAPRTSVVGKQADGQPEGGTVVEKSQAESMISEMMKTESGRTMLADAAIRAAQQNGFSH